MITTTQLGKNGRLGNQLFQIAAVIGAAYDWDVPFYIPPWKYSRFMENPLPQSASVVVGVFPHGVKIETIYREPTFHYTPIPQLRLLDLDGYFQSEKYFSEASMAVRYYFTPSEETQRHLRHHHHTLLALPQTVAVHVRRGDYVNSPAYHPVLPESYYREALKRFDPGACFVFMSDDLEYTSRIYKDVPNAVFVTEECDIYSLFLLAQCHHQIIANSSFSWWAAWLNRHPAKRVIAPKAWFGPMLPNDTRDLYCRGWEVL